jgi:hypothetical protein
MQHISNIRKRGESRQQRRYAGPKGYVFLGVVEQTFDVAVYFLDLNQEKLAQAVATGCSACRATLGNTSSAHFELKPLPLKHRSSCFDNKYVLRYDSLFSVNYFSLGIEPSIGR